MKIAPGVLKLFEECTFFIIFALFCDFWHFSTFWTAIFKIFPLVKMKHEYAVMIAVTSRFQQSKSHFPTKFMKKVDFLLVSFLVLI